MPQFESIYGKLRPQFIYDKGGASEATVTLNYFTPDKDSEEEDRSIVQENKLQADRMILCHGGNFWEFSGIVNLFRWGSLVTVKEKMLEIYQYNNQLVVLHKYSDGPAYKDSEGNDILWFFHCYPKNREALDYRDIMIVNFRSCKAPDFSKMLE